MSTTVKVSTALLEKAFESCSIQTLKLDLLQSTAKVFQWRGKAWTFTSGVSFHHQWESIRIREVVPVALWEKPFNIDDRRTYTGLRFRLKGTRETWVMTENEVRLVPDPDASPLPVQPELL